MAFGGFLSEAVISYRLLVGKREAVILYSCSSSAARAKRGMATLLGCVFILSTSPSSLPCCWLLSSLTEIIHAGIFRNTKIFIKSALITVSQNYLPSVLSLKTSLLTGFSAFSRTLFSTSGGTANAAVKKTNLPAFSSQKNPVQVTFKCQNNNSCSVIVK